MTTAGAPVTAAQGAQAKVAEGAQGCAPSAASISLRRQSLAEPKTLERPKVRKPTCGPGTCAHPPRHPAGWLCLKTSGLLLPSAGKRWLATTAARTQEVSGKAQGLQFVVHEAEYLKQEFLRGHGGSSLVSTE